MNFRQQASCTGSSYRWPGEDHVRPESVILNLKMLTCMLTFFILVREVIFYKTCAGKTPVEEFLDALSAKDAQKAAWVIRLVEDMVVVPRQYFQKMVNTDDLWEIRVRVGKDRCAISERQGTGKGNQL